MTQPVRIIVFAKAPEPGRVKTRLIPVLGAEGAARLAGRLLLHTVGKSLRAGLGAVELCVDPAPDTPVWQALRETLPPDDRVQLQWSAQVAGDLGARMATAAGAAIQGGEAVILLGTDCPALTTERLQELVAQLAAQDAVLVPACDGGYVALALRQFSTELFTGIPWGSDRVLADTLARLQQLGWRVATLPALPDIDEAADLQHLPADWPENTQPRPGTAAPC